MLDIKVITMYDLNPYGNFTLIFLCVGVLVGGGNGDACSWEKELRM